MGRKAFYETPEEFEYAITEFKKNNAIYSRKELMAGLGYNTITSLYAIKRRKGLEHIFDDCVFCNARKEGYRKQEDVPKKQPLEKTFVAEINKKPKPMSATELVDYADSMEDTIKEYVRKRTERGRL